MRIRRRKPRARRLEELALDVRTARWLGKLLWRPALLLLAGRTRARMSVRR